jgi:hypothetical protein
MKCIKIFMGIVPCHRRYQCASGQVSAASHHRNCPRFWVLGWISNACVLVSYVQNYYDNRYWTLWKLPMFGCTDPIQVRSQLRDASF